MKALRELLIRMDSMDVRLGNYGENLRRVNGILFERKKNPNNNSLDQSAFHRTIDQLTLDDSVDPLDRSRSCNETSFFEVLDDINSSLSQPPDKFVIGNKRVQIISGHSNDTSNEESDQTNTNPTDTTEPRPVPPADQDNQNPPLQPRNERHPGSDSLKVVQKRPQSNIDEHQSSFYVTPFSPDQSEAAILSHICEIANVDRSLVKVVKLIPRGKDQRDLTFVSFKVIVPNNVQNIVGDKWYWPDGIEVRTFEPREKNYSHIRTSEET